VDPEHAKEDKKPLVDDFIEVKLKKSSSMTKIAFRSPGYKRRMLNRRASIGSSEVDPEHVQEDKKPLRRLLKSLSHNMKRVAIKKELNGAESKSEISMSDRSSEQKEQKAKKKTYAKSDHIPNPRRSGISRSNSDKNLRLLNRQVNTEEFSFVEKLKASKSFRVNKSSSMDEDSNKSQSPNSRRAFFSKKRSGSVGSTDDGGDLDSTSTHESGTTSSPKRKIRSGTKKRDSKTPTGSGSTFSLMSAMSSPGSVTAPPFFSDKSQSPTSRRGFFSKKLSGSVRSLDDGGDLDSISTHESGITSSPKRKIRSGTKKRDSKTSTGSGSTFSLMTPMSSPGGSVTTLPPQFPDAPDSQRSLDSGSGRSKLGRSSSNSSKRSSRSGKKSSPKQGLDPTPNDNTNRKVPEESSLSLVEEVTPSSESALPAATPNSTEESNDEHLVNGLDELLG